MRLGITGHRPDKLGGHGPKVARALRELARAEIQALGPELVITGMALGWDQACAEAALELGIPFQALVPFMGQEKIWPNEAKAKYFKLLGAAKEVSFVSSGGFATWKLLARNRAIVALSEHLLALYDGSSGGTRYCVDFAAHMHTPVTNCWERYNPPVPLKPPRPPANLPSPIIQGHLFVEPTDTSTPPF